MKKILIISFLLVVLIIALNSNSSGPVDMQQYLMNSGYKVISYEGEVDSYTFNRAVLLGWEGPYYTPAWMLIEAQNEIDAREYYNKTITVHSFKVKKHALIPWRNSVKLKVCENEIIGGISYPNYILPQIFGWSGGPLPLDHINREWEDMTGMSYTEWTDLWEEKYK